MQALKIDHHGPASELKVSEVPVPALGPSDVLVEIEAAAINPSDVLSAEGRFPNAPLPRILGRDFAGRVCEGPADLVGKLVWGSGGDLGIARDGTHAEYVAIPRDAVALRPSTLDRGGLREGEWVIISGAAGAVGSAAVQIAATRGAKVIALVKNESEAARVDREKVAAIAHSESNDLAEVVSRATADKKAALAVNAVGGVLFEPLLTALAEGGRMVVFSVIGGREVSLDLLPFYRANLTLHGLNTAPIDVVRGAKIMNALAPLFESGAIPPPHIAATYPLSQAAEAYQQVSGGKIVLIPDRFYQQK